MRSAAQARIALRAAAERAVALGSHDQALTLPRSGAGGHDRPGRARPTSSSGPARPPRPPVTTRPLNATSRRAIAAQRELGDRVAAARATAALGRRLPSATDRPTRSRSWCRPCGEFADLATDPRGHRPCRPASPGHTGLAGDLRRAIEVADRVSRPPSMPTSRPIVADTLVTKGTALGVASAGRRRTRRVLGRGQRARRRHGLRAIRRSAPATTAAPSSLCATRGRHSIPPGRPRPRAPARAAEPGLDPAQQRWRVPLRTGDWSSALAELEAARAEELEGWTGRCSSRPRSCSGSPRRAGRRPARRDRPARRPRRKPVGALVGGGCDAYRTSPPGGTATPGPPRYGLLGHRLDPDAATTGGEGGALGGRFRRGSGGLAVLDAIGVYRAPSRRTGGRSGRGSPRSRAARRTPSPSTARRSAPGAISA